MPSQKPGTAMKRIDSARATPSGTLFGLNALRMPTGRPTSHETNSASTPISALIGPRCAISSETVSPRKNDLPRRPAAMSRSQWTYCSGSGSLSPRSAMMRTRSAGVIRACPSNPRMATSGSPGRIRRITKMLSETPSSVTAAYTARRARYFRMLRVRRGMWGAPRGPPRQSSEPDVVPSDHVVDPEVGRRVLAVDLVVPGVVDLLVRHRDKRRIGLQNVFGLADHRPAPVVVQLALDLIGQVVESGVGSVREVFRAVLDRKSVV